MLSLKSAESSFKNWSSSVHCNPNKVVAPKKMLHEFIQVVQMCEENDLNIRVVGAGHSFTPLVAIEDVLLSLDSFNGIDHIDFRTLSFNRLEWNEIKRFRKMVI